MGRYMIPEEIFFLVIDISSTFSSESEKSNEDVAMRFY